MQSKKNNKLNSTQKILIIGFSCLILAVVVVAILLWGKLSSMSQTDTSGAGGNYVIDESNLADVKEAMAQKVEDGYFEVNMNTAWTFPNGEEPSTNAYVANGNANSLPITFEILLEEEVIYSSGLIPVGNRIKEIKLDKDLDAGTYDAVCMYHLWKEDGTENSSFGVNITIVVHE